MYGHDWNPMPDMEVDILRGGVRIFGRGVREKGGSDEPPLVTGLLPYRRSTNRILKIVKLGVILIIKKNDHINFFNTFHDFVGIVT